MTEEWRDIPGWEGRYQASNKGRIRYISGRVRKQHFKRGYPSIALKQNGKKNDCFVHVLIALTFLGCRPDGHDVDHIDRNKTNNEIDNLRYLPRSENAAQSGRTFRGEKNPRSKLTDKQRCEIRRLWATGAYKTFVDLGAEFGIHGRTTSDIVNGRNGPVDCPPDHMGSLS